jgi:hypothetical protein
MRLWEARLTRFRERGRWRHGEAGGAV